MGTITSSERAERLRLRLRTARHHVLGPIAPEREPGTVFDPLPMFFDPGWLKSLEMLVKARARRAGVGSTGDIPAGYSRKQIREGAEQSAWEAFLDRFLTRDYKRAGITASETARAVLSTLRMAERSFWTAPMDRAMLAERWGMYPLFNRAQDSRTPDPRRVAHASRFSHEDTTALQGDGDDIPTGSTVPVKGGNYQPMGNGEMVWRERETGGFTAPVILDGDIVIPTDRAEEYAITDGRWRMERKRAGVQSYPACEVDPGKPAPRVCYAPQPAPVLSAWVDDGGEVCNRATARRMESLPAVDRQTALANLRRRGRGYDRGTAERAAVAHAIRRFR